MVVVWVCKTDTRYSRFNCEWVVDNNKIRSPCKSKHAIAGDGILLDHVSVGSQKAFFCPSPKALMPLFLELYIRVHILYALIPHILILDMLALIKICNRKPVAVVLNKIFQPWTDTLFNRRKGLRLECCIGKWRANSLMTE